jgi:hypothetical protein
MAETEQRSGAAKERGGQQSGAAGLSLEAARAAAQRKKDELALAIELSQLTVEQATQQFKEWLDQHVIGPHRQAQQAVAQAQAIREAQRLEEQTPGLPGYGPGQPATGLPPAMPAPAGPPVAEPAAPVGPPGGGAAGSPDFGGIAERAAAQALAAISPTAAAYAHAGTPPAPAGLDPVGSVAPPLGGGW